MWLEKVAAGRESACVVRIWKPPSGMEMICKSVSISLPLMRDLDRSELNANVK